MGIADRVIEKYSGQNLSQKTIDSGSVGDRVIAKYKGSAQMQQPVADQPETTFGSFIKDMGIGLVQGVAKVAMSAGEFARPTTIKSVFTAPWKYKEPEATDFGVNIFGKRITSIQRSMQDAETKLKSGEITKKQFAGVAAENALDAISVIPAGKLAAIFGKGIAKEAIAQGTKGVVKEVAKESLKKKIVKIAATGAGFGTGYGASEDLKANKETGEIISNAPWNAVMGAGVGLGFAGAAKVAGKLTGKVVNKIKGRNFTDQVAEITQKTAPERPKGTMADIVTKKDTIVPLKPWEVNPEGKIMEDIKPPKTNVRPGATGQISPKPEDIIATLREERKFGKPKEPVKTPEVDVDSIIKGAGIKLKVSDKKSIPALGGKKAQGKSRYNFEDGTGEIVVAKDASPSTKAHELAHVMNFKLGDKKEKFTNQLSKYATGQSKDIPAKVVDFARAEMGKGVPENKILARASELAKTMHEEMKTAARLDKKAEFRLGNPSEEFSTAVGNVITRSGETEQVAPNFSKFVKNQFGKAKEAPIVKEAPVLYHGTNEKSYNKITKEGLVASEKEGTMGKGIYLGNDEDTAKLFGEKIIKISIDKKAKILDLSKEKKNLSGTKMNKLVDKARADGYDGIKTNKQTLIFNKDVIKIEKEKSITPVVESENKLPLKKLIDVEGEPIKETIKKIPAGEKSMTKGAIDVAKTEDGYMVLDGQHRAAEALKSGKSDIDVKILSKKEAIKKYGDRWPEAVDFISEDSPKIETPKSPLIQEARKQMTANEIEFIKSKGVDINKLKLVEETTTPKEILSRLSPEHQKDVLSKVGRVSAEKSTSTPIIIQGKNGLEILDGGHSLAGKLKENKPIRFLSQPPQEGVKKKVEIKTGAPKETQISAGGKVAKNITPIKTESINLEKINTTDDVKNTIDTIAKNDKEIIDRQRRGKITNQELDELSEMTGIKTKDIVNAKPGSVVNAENALAVRKLMINSAQDLTDFASGMGAAPDEKSMGIFKQKLDKFRGLQNALSGFRSEAGRLLQQFNVKVSPQEYEMMDELLKKVSTISQESGDELSKAMKIGKELKPDNLYQLAIKSGVEARTAFLLYSPTTHAANLVGNTWQALNMPLKKYIAEKISGGKGVVKGEASAHIQGVKDALPEAWKLLKDDMKLIFTGKEIQGLEKMQEVTHGQRKAMETLSRLGVSEKTAEKVDSIIKTSFKLLTASDKFFRTVNFAGELYSQGLRKATKEGLKGEALTKRIGQILDDPALDKEMYDDIMKQVDVSLFQENTEASKAVSRIREKYQVSKLIIPFVKTPLNVAIETVRTSPLGFLRPAMAKARGKAYTEAEKSLAYAQATVGTALSVVGLGLVSQGKITGGLPSNRAERDEFYASGKQPYSIKVGNQWVSYRRVEPMASVLANTVNAYNTSKEADDWSEAVGKTVSGYVNNFFDQTFLKGISDIYNAASDPDRYGKSFVQSFATSFVPSISRSVTGASDRTYREGETISDAFKKIIPGVSKTLPAKVDIFGNEVKKEGGFIEGFVSPFQRAKETNDPVVKELEKSDYNLTVSGVDKIGGVQLKGEAKEVWLKAVGKETKKALDKLVTSPSFQNKDQVQKDKALKDAVEDIRDRMRKQVTAGGIQYDINQRKKMTKSDQAKFNENQLEGKLTERVKALSSNWATK